MIKLLLSKILKVYRYINEYIDLKINQVTLDYKKVRYRSIPSIKGRITINNDGIIELGENVVFNCAMESNYVGLFKPCTISVSANAILKIGNNTGLSGVSIYCAKGITIGNYVNIGGNVCIWDTDFHPLNYLDRRVHLVDKINTSPIRIEDDAFIGANSIILKGVTIGEKSIVGAGSVVTKSIPANEIWAGNPAKLIRKNEITKLQV